MSENLLAARRGTLTIAAAVTGSVIGILALTACGGQGSAAAPADVDPSQVKVGSVSYNLTADQKREAAPKNAAIAAQLPAAIREKGVLVIGSWAAGGGNPPLSFTANDNKTPIGVEIDIAHLVADILGLKPEIQTTSFENIFLGLDSGKYQVGISNIGVSELRKQKYDFASYRLGLHAFEAKKGSGWKINGPADISGKKVAVGSGTLQEDILLRWNAENEKAGRPPAELTYYQQTTEYYLALQSGRVDIYLGPNPTASYHVATAKQTEIIGTVSSAFPVTGLVGVTTKKGSGVAKPVAEALNTAIKDGSYAKVLAKWGLQDEAVKTSQVNPPGLPINPNH